MTSSHSVQLATHDLVDDTVEGADKSRTGPGVQQ